MFNLCLVDLLVMLQHYSEVGEMFYLFHHGSTIYAYYFVMVSIQEDIYIHVVANNLI